MALERPINLNDPVQFVVGKDAPAWLRTALDRIQHNLVEEIGQHYFAGVYSASVQYHRKAIVTLNGNGYVALDDPPIGTSPSNATYWEPIEGFGKTTYARFIRGKLPALLELTTASLAIVDLIAVSDGLLPGVQEVQTVTLAGQNGGTFTINGGTNLAYNASAATVESNLETSLSAGVAVTRTGAGSVGDPYVYQITWDLMGSKALLAVNGANLTLGGNPVTTITAAQVTDGASVTVYNPPGITSSYVWDGKSGDRFQAHWDELNQKYWIDWVEPFGVSDTINVHSGDLFIEDGSVKSETKNLTFVRGILRTVAAGNDEILPSGPCS